jgi:monoamine oxidase
MASPDPAHILIAGAGAAGLMAAHELARAGAKVTVLEARDRIGGRIYPLPSEKFGYAAEGGAEFVHGDAPVTRALVRDLGLSFAPRSGARWRMRAGVLQPRDQPDPHEEEFQQALMEVKKDLTIAEFLQQHFGSARYDTLRRNIIRMVQGYDLADPNRISALAIRDEWMPTGERRDSRIDGGYGLMIEKLAGRCRERGVDIRLGVEVQAIEKNAHRIVVRCADGTAVEADSAVLSVPLPILSRISLPVGLHRHIEATRDIGFGNVVKILLRFRRMWWADHGGRNFADLSFLQTDAQVPTWWTQYPADHAVLTGWYPQPDAGHDAAEDEIIENALASLSGIFGVAADMLKNELVAARAIDWKDDPFARGAYSYATPRTLDAQRLLNSPNGSGIFFSGEALYTGPDIGTVEAALASGQQTAQTVLATGR